VAERARRSRRAGGQRRAGADGRAVAAVGGEEAHGEAVDERRQAVDGARHLRGGERAAVLHVEHRRGERELPRRAADLAEHQAARVERAGDAARALARQVGGVARGDAPPLGEQRARVGGAGAVLAGEARREQVEHPLAQRACLAGRVVADAERGDGDDLRVGVGAAHPAQEERGDAHAEERGRGEQQRQAQRHAPGPTPQPRRARRAPAARAVRLARRRPGGRREGWGGGVGRGHRGIARRRAGAATARSGSAGRGRRLSA
jgi:hypothetical protein